MRAGWQNLYCSRGSAASPRYPARTVCKSCPSGRTMTQTLHILSAGAAFGLITASRAEFEARADCGIEAQFAAVGTTEDCVRAVLDGAGEGAACGLFVLTPAAIALLIERYPGRIVAAGTLGTTPGALACAGDPEDYDISTVAALRATLASLDVIYTGDLTKSTIGRHLVRVLHGLGLSKHGPEVVGFPGGAKAVEMLAEAGAKRALACAQLTEIRQNAGARAVGSLPGEYALDTEYSLAVIEGPEAGLARAFAAHLTAREQTAARAESGFDPV